MILNAGRKQQTKVMAEVQCRTCKKSRFVDFEDRFLGAKPKESGHTRIRCPTCPAGKDLADYTGRIKTAD